MLITLCSIIASILMWFFTPVPANFNPMNLAVLYIIGGTSILFTALYLHTSLLTPLSMLEQKLIPNLMELIHRDFPLRLGRLYLFLFTLFSTLSAALVTRFENVSHPVFFLGWFVFFAMALDTLRDSWRRYVLFLSPAFITTKIATRAASAIKSENRTAFLNDLDSLAEIGVRSVEQSKLALSTQTLQALPPILKTYFDSAKSIGHLTPDSKESGNIPGGDATSFAIFYLIQRLELINDKALRDRQETVCRQMIMSLGKIIVHCAQFDLSLVAFPTHFLTKFGLKAQQHYFDEVAVLTTSTLSEISKSIINGIDLTYLELQESFQAIINGFAAIARASYKRDKNTNIRALIQPLIELKALFRSEKMIHHRDTAAILQQIDNVVDEFSILEQVMMTLPAISGTDPSEETIPEV